MTGDDVKRAKYAVQRALRDGTLAYPDACQRCGRPPTGRRFDSVHLNGYEPPHQLDVEFWCRSCVVATRNQERNAKPWRLTDDRDDERRRYVELVDDASAELRFRLRAAGLRQTERDYVMDRYFPQRGAVSVLWHVLDEPKPDRRELDVLLRAIEVMEKHVPDAAPPAVPSDEYRTSTQEGLR